MILRRMLSTSIRQSCTFAKPDPRRLPSHTLARETSWRCQYRMQSTQVGVKEKHRPRTLPMFSLEGKVCLVTGAARGLGFEFCRAFIASGCTQLVLLDVEEKHARRAAEKLKESSSRFDPGIDKDKLEILGLGCNVASEESVKEAFKNTVSRFGTVDAVVACAGICEHFPVLDYETDRMKRLFDINVFGALYTAREAATHMIPAGGGSIVIVASMSGTIVNAPQPQAPYNASKAAVKHLADSLAVEWAKKGVRVNSLSPGYMRTKMTSSVLEAEEGLVEAWKALTPMGRLGDPEELDGAIVYLCSDASKFMTGAEIRVDGGYCVL